MAERSSWVRIGLLSALVASGLVWSPGPPAAAAPVAAATSPLAGWRTNGPVYATTVIGTTVYVGGNFTSVRDQSGTSTATRTNLAAFDLTTGALRTGWTADTNGVVRALATDGNRLFVGGSFTSVRGVTRNRLAALDPTSGAVVTGFSANASSHVYALGVHAGRLYAGGAFGTIGGQARTRLAAVSTATGAVDAQFVPQLDNSVRAIVPAPNGDSVYVGGQFTVLGGVSQSFLGQVRSTTGANTGLRFGNPPNQSTIALAIAPDGARLFVGAMNNRVASYNATTGTRQWYQQAEGDMQAVAYFEGNVYFGFHEGFAGDFGVRALAADANTGALENWRPSINSFYGVWAITTAYEAVVLGGEFTRVGGVSAQGVAIMSTGRTPVPTTTTSTSTTTSSTTTTTTTTLPGGGTAVTAIPAGAVWRFTEDGVNRGTAWTASGYDDTSWRSGPAQLGYGDGDEATVMWNGGTTTTDRFISHYLRRSFAVTNAAGVGSVTISVLADDGAVVYVNGAEVLRDNMPAGTITNTTYASTGRFDAAESAFRDFVVPAGLLVEGTNVIAVSVHNNSRSGTGDLSFDTRVTLHY